MKIVNIREKLSDLGRPVEDISLGDFDMIGHYTAYKTRNRNSELYRKHGCFFRANYERGILAYTLVRKFNINTFLEIGFGCGYTSLCVAKAMADAGIDGSITTVDPNFDQNRINIIQQVFPEEWLSKISFVNEKSQDFLAKNDKYFDYIYIDGDHRYEAVKTDWELSKDKFNKILVFDDYHLPTKIEKDIECSKLIDAIEDFEKELIIMDRRIFADDRGWSDKQIDYGQVLIKRGEK
jgi:predicted O-methyltransferase YrrM